MLLITVSYVFIGISVEIVYCYPYSWVFSLSHLALLVFVNKKLMVMIIELFILHVVLLTFVLCALAAIVVFLSFDWFLTAALY